MSSIPLYNNTSGLMRALRLSMLAKATGPQHVTVVNGCVMVEGRGTVAQFIDSFAAHEAMVEAGWFVSVVPEGDAPTYYHTQAF